MKHLALVFIAVLLALPTFSHAAHTNWLVRDIRIKNCSLEDYVVKYGPCANPNDPSSLRPQWYELLPGQECVGAKKITIPTKATCACTREELAPLVNTCVMNTQEIFNYNKVSGSSCVLQEKDQSLPKRIHVPCLCTQDDIASSFTPCQKFNGVYQRSAVYYWRRRCTPTGSFRLPDPIWAPCDPTCLPGEAVVAPNPLCAECDAGTYSIRGKRYDPPYMRIPAGFSVMCLPTGDNYEAPCDSWRPAPDNSYLYSGDNSGRNNLFITMSVHVEIQTYPAFVTFDVNFDTEKDADFFVVYVDGKISKTATGNSEGWAPANVSLDPPADKLPCKWRLDSSCIYENQLFPYESSLWFNPDTLPGDDRKIQVIYLDDPCTLAAFNGAASKIAIVTGHASSCTLEQRTLLALRADAAGILVCDHVTAPSPHFSGDSQNIMAAIRPGFIAGMISHDDALRFRTSSVAVLHYAADPAIRHLIEFAYVKDLSRSVGADQVKLRNIVVHGSQSHADTCLDCPVGYGSRVGAEKCTKCPANTFAGTPGTAYPCHPCPRGHQSPPGSTVCTRTPECTIDDYVVRRHQCTRKNDLLVQRVEYVLVQPPICNVEQSKFEPPEPFDAPCGECSDGYVRNPATLECEACPRNKVSVGKIGSVRTCEFCSRKGTAPLLEEQYANFDRLNGTFPPHWSTSCTNCFGSAWAFSTAMDAVKTDPSSFLIIGRSVLPDAVADLEINKQFNSGARIEMTYHVGITKGHENELNNFNFTLEVLNGETGAILETHVLTKPTTPNEVVRPTFYLTPGNKTIRIRYHKFSTATVNVPFQLTSLGLISVTEGHGRVCNMCPVGHFCREHSEPRLCPRGHFAALPGSWVCQKCNVNPQGMGLQAVAPNEGTEMCAVCGNGLIMSKDQTACILPMCQLTTFFGGQAPAISEVFPVRAAGTPLKQNKARFDLSGLDQQINAVTKSGPSQLAGASLNFSLCTADVNRCSADDPAVSFGCAQPRNSPGFNLGPQLSFNGMFDSRGDANGFTATIYGNPCRTDEKRPQKTLISVVCDPNEIWKVEDGSYFTCKFEIKARSRFACPLCTNFSFVFVDTPCDNDGYRTRRYTYATGDGIQTPDPTCLGGMPLPSPRRIKCPWATINIDKKVSPFWIVVLSVLLLLLLLVVISCYLCASKKALKSRYQSLQNASQADAVSMHDVVSYSDRNTDFDRHNSPSSSAARKRPERGEEVTGAASTESNSTSGMTSTANGSGDRGAAGISGQFAASAVSTMPSAASTSVTNDGDTLNEDDIPLDDEA